jgi:hypothetical protein
MLVHEETSGKFDMNNWSIVDDDETILQTS